jgi:hypothetical protein
MVRTNCIQLENNHVVTVKNGFLCERESIRDNFKITTTYFLELFHGRHCDEEAERKMGLVCWLRNFQPAKILQ